MTTATDASGSGRAATPAGRARPLRIGPWRRFELRRLGRGDGAIALPDPGAVPSPLTTDARSMLMAALFARVSELWEGYFISRARRQTVLVDHRGELPALQAAVAAVRNELETARETAPMPDNVRPGPGEQARGRSTELLVARRRRVHQRLLADLDRRLESAQQAVDRVERTITRIETEDTEHRHLTGVREHRLIATFLCERMIYDRAFVRRHPLGPELGPKLDRSPPPLSGWARASLGQGPVS